MKNVNPKYLPVIKGCLNEIRYEMDRLYLDKNKKQISSPFDNTGEVYQNSVFAVRAYDWSKDGNTLPNFQYRSLYVWWRGSSNNELEAICEQEITLEYLSDMMDECYAAMRHDFKVDR